jgi:hypothetical protein
MRACIHRPALGRNGARGRAVTITHHFGWRLCQAILLLVCTVVPAAGDGSRRPCLRACKVEQRSCVGLARTTSTALRAACTGAGSARARCLRGTRTVLRTARASCARLRKDCRACCRAGGQGPTCPVGRPVPFAPPPEQDVTKIGLPKLPSGRFLAIAIPGAQLEIDPTLHTPVTALGRCTRWIAACVDGATRSLDDCARSAPPCATDRPWEEVSACCPTACFEAYQAARRAGAEPLAAARGTYFADGSCFPGVAAVRGRGGR